MNAQKQHQRSLLNPFGPSNDGGSENSMRQLQNCCLSWQKQLNKTHLI